MRRRRILSAGFVARIEDRRLSECVMFCGRHGGARKRVNGCLLDDLRAFGIYADQCTAAAQNKEKYGRTVKQGA